MKLRYFGILAFLLVACTGEDKAECGNGILEPGELCDGTAGVPSTCAAWDGSKTWAAGAPACAPTCEVVEIGFCVEAKPYPGAQCGNNIIEVGEVCDGTSVLKSCAEYDPSKTWKAGGKPGCAVNCFALTQGTCQEGTDISEPSTPGTSDPNVPSRDSLTDPNLIDIDEITSERCNVSSADYQEHCAGQVATICIADGYVVKRDCSKLGSDYSCQLTEDGEYADCVTPCKESTFKPFQTCQGAYVLGHMCEKAQNGQTYAFGYTPETPCEVACSDGRCVSEPKPQVGATCDARFKARCFDGSIYRCEGGQVRQETCVGELRCAQRYGSQDPVCAEPCNAAQTNQYGCKKIDGKDALDNRVCELAEGARWYWFEENTICASKCTAGVCDQTIPTVGEPCERSMSDMCAQNALYYCSTETHTVVKMECGVGDSVNLPLCRHLDADYADCVVPCQSDAESLLQCATSNKTGAYTDNYVCKTGLDGQMYRFSEQEPCPNGCRDGVCL